MIKLKYFLLSLLLPVSALHGWATSITYANAGTIAPQTLIYASQSGGISAYYLGSTAGNEDQIDLYDVTTGFDSGKILDNKTNSVGAKVVIGAGAGQINAGDQLILYIDTAAGRFSSVAANSPDGINHAYINAAAGGTLNGVVIPSGLFVGMEDITYKSSDLNYNDDDFMLVGVTTTAGTAVTAEPISLAFFATGLAAIIVLVHTRNKKEKLAAMAAGARVSSPGLL